LTSRKYSLFFMDFLMRIIINVGPPNLISGSFGFMSAEDALVGRLLTNEQKGACLAVARQLLHQNNQRLSFIKRTLRRIKLWRAKGGEYFGRE